MSKDLPDILGEGLNVIFCGFLTDRESLMMQHYYASPRDCFWHVLHEVAFTPEQIKPTLNSQIKEANYQELLFRKIGLTNLVKDEVLENVQKLNDLIKNYKPKVLAFNGKKAAELYFGRSVEYGEQKERISKTRIFVLSSTANSARTLWVTKPWRDLSKFLRI